MTSQTVFQHSLILSKSTEANFSDIIKIKIMALETTFRYLNKIERIIN